MTFWKIVFTKQALLLLSSLLIFIAGHSQLTDTFKSIDLKSSFKDIKFGSSYSQIKNKMGLIKKDNPKNADRYNITNDKYLSVGIYDIINAFVEFNDDKLSMIVFEVPHNYKEVLNYFTKMFGKPKFNNMWLWEGKSINYVLGGDKNTSNALVIISSKQVQVDDGKNNF